MDQRSALCLQPNPDTGSRQPCSRQPDHSEVDGVVDSDNPPAAALLLESG